MDEFTKRISSIQHLGKKKANVQLFKGGLSLMKANANVSMETDANVLEIDEMDNVKQRVIGRGASTEYVITYKHNDPPKEVRRIIEESRKTIERINGTRSSD
jgi:hypothetical protein